MRFQRRGAEAGSALWMVLIGVVLFAALSAAVAQMMRGTGDVRTEMGNVNATQLLQFTDALRKSVQAMAIDGIPVGRISFDTPQLTGYDNTACTTSDCKVFDVNGGGVSFDPPDKNWLDDGFAGEDGYGQWLFPDDSCVKDYPGKDAGDCASDTIDNEELMVMLPFMRADVCAKIDAQAGIAGGGGAIPEAASCHSAGGKFIGAFAEGNAVDAPGLEGQPAGCFKQPDTCGASQAGYYVYYKVLIGR
jgi:hypothetical protein